MGENRDVTAIPTMDDTSIDSPVAWHFGDPLREQRELVAGNGRVDLSHYGVVTVSGPDRHSWMNSLTTQDFLTPFTSLQALILSPHGHVEHDLHVIDDGEVTWLIVEPGTSQALAEYLLKMRFMLQVEIEDVSAEFAVVGAPGHLAGERVWHSPDAFLSSFDSDVYVSDRPESWVVSELIVSRDELEATLTQSSSVGTWAWEAHRIRAGVPRLSFETDHKTIPHEVGLISAAVHLKKGCYRGQETIARVYNLGKPPRRLVRLEIDGSTNELPVIGMPVMLEEKEVGRLTSITQDYESGPLGLAVIKRSIPVDAILTVGGVAAAQTPIVL